LREFNFEFLVIVQGVVLQPQVAELGDPALGYLVQLVEDKEQFEPVQLLQSNDLVV